MESPRDNSPLETAIHEVKLETGMDVVLLENRTLDPHDLEHGELLKERKSRINNTIYTYLLKRTNGNIDQIKESSEGGAVGSFSLMDILLMPLARQTTGEIHSYGIYFSHRKRIIIVLKRAGYDFLELAPNLPELLENRDEEELRSEWGDEVYDILTDAVFQNDIRIAEANNIETDEYIVVVEEGETTIEVIEEPPAECSEQPNCPCDACYAKWAIA
jgi:hypothetical protein